MFRVKNTLNTTFKRLIQDRTKLVFRLLEVNISFNDRRRLTFKWNIAFSDIHMYVFYRNIDYVY